MTDSPAKPSGPLAAVHNWLKANEVKQSERRAARKARIAAMPPARRRALRFAQGALVAGGALGFVAGWGISAPLAAMLLAEVALPLIDPHPKTWRRIGAGIVISLPFMTLMGALIFPPALSAFGPRPMFPSQDIKAANAQLLEHRDEVGAAAAQMEERWKDGTLTWLSDVKMAADTSGDEAPYLNHFWYVRNDAPAAAGIDGLVRLAARGIDPNFDAADVYGVGNMLTMDRLVILVDQKAIEEKSERWEKLAVELAGVPVEELTAEDWQRAKPEFSPDTFLFCSMSGDQVQVAKTVPEAYYFDLKTLPEAAPIYRVCAEVAKTADLSRLPKFGANGEDS